jgi:hypothetical protein
MNKEKLEERIKTLTEECTKTQALLAMYEGALQDCQFWLQQLEDKTDVDTGNAD